MAGEGLTGLVGLAADVIAALGEVGVAVATLAETVFPPLPSEVVLPLAGYLAQQGEMSLPLVVVAATVGGWVGALLLYWLGAALGEQRAIGVLARVPLLDRDDLERAAGWFHRHGRPAVGFGRLVPGVRSLISLPAGAARMPLLQFSLLTVLGSAVWNALLVGAGAALGTQYRTVERYAHVLDYAVYAALAGAVGWLVIRRARRARVS
ncbi:DedA family protein [Angustibacter aerolatus]|uniref:VTT domain-containing protein n=1 Tax=Angustibacter aerolatus TaxID=1162965 RepID=A0ABQ6JJA8_9ACTN|nr:DedA family protein [Angustibacter aerolatus]GMA86886.1 hypothetical protein GCM10025868_21360 [Angustibacter aerolatus]